MLSRPTISVIIPTFGRHEQLLRCVESILLDADSTSEILIVDLALLPEFQRKGIGTYLMRQSMDRGAQVRKPVTGTVLWYNVASLEFVRKLGFVGTRADEIFVGVEWRSNQV